MMGCSPYTADIRVRTAKKEHTCAAKSGCTIKPGEKYIDEAIPPWTLILDDPDGRPFAMGNWMHVRYHGKCELELEFGM